jgi:Xaa-Pro aminopeptidase
MHGFGHWLGLDVHDVGDYGRNRSVMLEPGMVLTVEPGLYFSPHQASVPAALRGMGVRIEDNILVTTDGCENLSIEIPKKPAEVMSLMSQAA